MIFRVDNMRSKYVCAHLRTMQHAKLVKKNRLTKKKCPKVIFLQKKCEKLLISGNNVLHLQSVLNIVMKETLVILTSAAAEEVELPVAEALRAGFPSPAADYAGDKIDINKELIRHPETSFYARIQGDSMRDAGIFDGDLAVIDRSLLPHDGDYVAACVDGEFTLKEYREDKESGTVLLIPHNPAFETIRVTDANSLIIWGVITYTIHKTR